MSNAVTREEFNALKQQVEDIQLGDLRFQQRCYQEFGVIHRQLQDHSQILGELKTDVVELKAHAESTDNKLDFICEYIRGQMALNNE